MRYFTLDGTVAISLWRRAGDQGGDVTRDVTALNGDGRRSGQDAGKRSTEAVVE